MHKKVVILFLLAFTVTQVIGAEDALGQGVKIVRNHTSVNQSKETHTVIQQGEFKPDEEGDDDDVKPDSASDTGKLLTPKPKKDDQEPVKTTHRPVKTTNRPVKSTHDSGSGGKTTKQAADDTRTSEDGTEKPTVKTQDEDVKTKKPSTLVGRIAPVTVQTVRPKPGKPQTSTPKPAIKPLTGARADIEKYMEEIYVYENSILRDHKVGVHWEVFKGRGLNYDDYTFHSLLGNIVQAGPKTRAYHLPGHKCGGLKKLYQYFNHADQTTRLTLNFRDTNNKGDRQPIGLCAARKGQCGADLPLYVYRGTHNTERDHHKPSYFYATVSNYNFTRDKANYKLVSDAPLCYIYSRSENRTYYDKPSDPDQNLHIRNIFSEIAPVYEFYLGGDVFYSRETLEDGDYKDNFVRHAFNVFKNDSFILARCQLTPIVDFVFVDKDTDFGFDRVVTNATIINQLRNNSTIIKTDATTDLGFGVAVEGECGAYIRYEVYQISSARSNKTETTYIARAGQKRYPDDVQFMNGYFYSL